MGTARFVGTNLQPFSVRGFERHTQLGTPISQRMMNFVGVQPAPTSLNKTAAEKLAEVYRTQIEPQGTRTSEQAARASIVRALRLGQNPVPLIQDAINKRLMTGRSLPALRVSGEGQPASVEAAGRAFEAGEFVDSASLQDRQLMTLLALRFGNYAD